MRSPSTILHSPSIYRPFQKPRHCRHPFSSPPSALLSGLSPCASYAICGLPPYPLTPFMPHLRPACWRLRPPVPPLSIYAVFNALCMNLMLQQYLVPEITPLNFCAALLDMASTSVTLYLPAAPPPRVLPSLLRARASALCLPVSTSASIPAREAGPFFLPQLLPTHRPTLAFA